MPEQNPDAAHPKAVSRIVEHMQGTITAVHGKKDGRGIPELLSATVLMGDGSEMVIGMPAVKGGKQGKGSYRPVKVERNIFDRCPICLEPGPKSKEHIPPESIGGRYLTRTCDKCNNEFGSKYEPHLKSWYEESIPRTYMQGGDVPGRRNSGSVLVRETADGVPVLIFDGGSDPAVDEILASGSFEWDARPYDREKAVLAAVKSAYLIACLMIGQIPTSPKADAIRAELVRARDFPRDQPYERGEAIRALGVAIGSASPQHGNIAILQLDEGDQMTPGILFNHRLFVEWPLDVVEVKVDRTTGEFLREE